MDDQVAKKRPTSITVMCIIGLFGALVTIPLIFSSIAQSIGAWYPPYLAFSALVGAACMVGLWMMKKWAVYVYIVFCGINQIVLLVMGVWNFMALILPAIVIFFMLRKVSQMS